MEERRRHNLSLRLLIGIALLFSVWRCWFLYQYAQISYLQITMQATSTGQMQLYYDRGYGFNEHDSTVVTVEKKDRDILQKITWFSDQFDSQYEDYQFDLPKAAIQAIRVQWRPYQPGAKAIIKEMEVVNGIGLPGYPVEIPNTLSLFGNDSETIFIPVASPIRSDLENPFLRLGFVVRVLIELVCIFGIAASLLLFRTLGLPVFSVTTPLRQITGYLCKADVQNKILFVCITAIFLWGYRPLNEQWFPILFEKSLFLLFVILAVRYFVSCSTDMRRMNTLLFVLVVAFIWAVLSAAMHTLAVHAIDGVNYLAIHTSDYQGVLFQKHEGFKRITDQMVYLTLFPLSLLVALSLFRSTELAWRKMTWLPLLYSPCLLVALYQLFVDRNFLNNRPLDDYVGGLAGSFVSFRILLFLVFPLCLLAVITVKKWWSKALYSISALIILFFLYSTVGRAAIIGTLMFIIALPLICLWVHEVQQKKYVYLVAGTVGVVVVTLLSGFAFPRYHNHLSKVFRPHIVHSVHDLLRGNYEGGAVRGRSEMTRQVWRLIKQAPVAGWGPAAFMKNADRIRFTHGDPPGVGQPMTNLYLQMLANFGVIGASMMFLLHFIPLWMVFRVRNHIRLYEERWAVGIVFVTTIIMQLTFLANPNIDYPEINWIYALYLGFLLSVAIKYGHISYTLQKKGMWAMSVSLLTVVFLAGTFHTSFGSKGYRQIRQELMTTVTRGYSEGAPLTLWDSKQKTGVLKKVSNTLIRTRGNPYRAEYTTNEFHLLGASDPVQLPPTSDLIGIKVSIANYKSQERFILALTTNINNNTFKKRFFYIPGEKMLFYKVPVTEEKDITLSLDVDLQRALPYHRDDREAFTQTYMPYHDAYKNLDVTVTLVPFIKKDDHAA